VSSCAAEGGVRSTAPCASPAWSYVSYVVIDPLCTNHEAHEGCAAQNPRAFVVL